MRFNLTLTLGDTLVSLSMAGACLAFFLMTADLTAQVEAVNRCQGQFQLEPAPQPKLLIIPATGVDVNGYYTLTDYACDNDDIVNQIMPQWVSQFKAGTGTVANPAIAAEIGSDIFAFCWIEKGEAIHLVNTTGGELVLPTNMFTATPSV